MSKTSPCPIPLVIIPVIFVAYRITRGNKTSVTARLLCSTRFQVTCCCMLLPLSRDRGLLFLNSLAAVQPSQKNSPNCEVTPTRVYLHPWHFQTISPKAEHVLHFPVGNPLLGEVDQLLIDFATFPLPSLCRHGTALQQGLFRRTFRGPVGRAVRFRAREVWMPRQSIGELWRTIGNYRFFVGFAVGPNSLAAARMRMESVRNEALLRFRLDLRMCLPLPYTSNKSTT